MESRRASLAASGVLAGLYVELIYDLLYVRHLFGQLFSFLLLRCGLDRSFQNKRAVLRRALDALIVQVQMGLDCGFEVMLYPVIQV